MMRHENLSDLKSFHVVSDIHLRTPQDSRSTVFLKYLIELKSALEQKNSHPEALFLLGDIFDFIYFPNSFHRNYWSEVLDSLASCKKLGLKIYFIEGNHDFGFEHASKTSLNRFFTLAGDFFARFEHPILGHIEMRHGDDVVCPPSYHAFRAVVKNRLFQACTSLVPGRMSYFVFSKYAALSRTKDTYRSLDPIFFADCVQAHLSKESQSENRVPNLLILGHVHVWIDNIVKETKVMVGPDWFSAPSVLKVDENGRCTRDWLDNAKTVPKFEMIHPQ